MKAKISLLVICFLLLGCQDKKPLTSVEERRQKEINAARGMLPVQAADIKFIDFKRDGEDWHGVAYFSFDMNEGRFIACVSKTRMGYYVVSLTKLDKEQK